MLPRIGPRPEPLTFRRRVIEEEVPAIPEEVPAVPTDVLEEAAVLPCEEGAVAVPLRLEVAGSNGQAGYPAMSPRSGRMKRPDGDFLQLNGEYELLPAPHNGAPCWQKPAGADCKEARVIFRSADGRSWVIDEQAHEGDPDALVLARKWTTMATPTADAELWMPVALCVHAAGVHCACKCLKDLGDSGKDTMMGSCC
mmetsp:Transcript_137410/g.293654  ORF Transcript_137410/g.293654 Transcript_137410/m.293654 type:complete len:197 (-) Transcript_137410:250-840(-)